jgi:hypothetical protein
MASKGQGVGHHQIQSQQQLVDSRLLVEVDNHLVVEVGSRLLGVVDNHLLGVADNHRLGVAGSLVVVVGILLAVNNNYKQFGFGMYQQWRTHTHTEREVD